MKDILIVLLVLVVAILTLGAVNHGVTFDLNYLFGTWHHVSLFWIFLIASGLIVAVGLLASGFSSVRLGQQRHKLESELEETYKRLRVAEAQIAAANGTPPADENLAAEEARVAKDKPVAKAVPGAKDKPVADESPSNDVAAPSADAATPAESS